MYICDNFHNASISEENKKSERLDQEFYIM